MLQRHIPRHGEHKGRFPHGGACGYDDEVALLPALGHLIEIVKSCGKPAEPLVEFLGLLYVLHHPLEDQLCRLALLLRAELVEFEYPLLRLLYQVVHVGLPIVGAGLHLCAQPYQLALQVLLDHDLGVLYRMHPAGHHARKRGQVGRPPHLL